MLPVVAIVGRPNVGKSTLFNGLTKSRDALVHDQPGVTRDRQYGEAEFEGRRYLLIDTGGIDRSKADLPLKMQVQVQQALCEADQCIFVVDARLGVSSEDLLIAKQLRALDKKVILAVNKTDGLDPDLVLAEFYQLGFSRLLPIAAAHRRNLQALQTILFADLPEIPLIDPNDSEKAIPVAIVGRPNVGKSTLVNRLLGEERVVVFDQPGTTRDTIKIPYHQAGQDYLLIDTAGVRRRKKIEETTEKFSVIKTLQAIEACKVVVFLLDARVGVLDQDLNLLSFILEAGRSLVIAVNKWDGLDSEQKRHFFQTFARKCHFVDFAAQHKISALHGTGVGKLLPLVKTAYESAGRPMRTAALTRLLRQAVEQHAPPVIANRRIKLRYANVGGYFPPTVVIHGNQTDKLPGDYRRYLNNYFMKALKLVGTPVRLIFRTGENPYQ